MELTVKRNNKVFAKILSMVVMLNLFVGQALAFGEDVTVTVSKDPDADSLMGKVLGVLLSITRYVGVALVIYGVYEIVMSFMQQQPEAKTKGIIMALAGVVMITLKTILGPNGVGIIG